MPELTQIADQALKEAEAPVTEEPKEEPKIVPQADPIEEPEEPEEEVEEVELEEEKPTTPTQLPPANQYVYDRLPTLSVKGKLVNGQIKEYKFKIPDELPDDFEFASGKEAALYNAKVADQSNNAKDLFAKYQQEQQDTQFKEFQAREERDVLSDMIALQQQGILPKFKYKETDPRFNDDESVKYINKILKYRDDLNTSYTEAGQMYRVPFSVATKMYISEHPVEKDPKQEKENAERKQVSKKVATAQGTTAKPAASVTRYRPGMSLKQIADNEARIRGIS